MTTTMIKIFYRNRWRRVAEMAEEKNAN